MELDEQREHTHNKVFLSVCAYFLSIDFYMDIQSKAVEVVFITLRLFIFFLSQFFCL